MTKEKDEIVETKVDKDILDFLKAIYFGDFTDPLKVASSRAYRDMNRTIRFNGLQDATRLALREKVNGVFEFLHIPLDNYVFDIARDLLGIARPKVAWSSWDNYDEQYLCYQNLIREKITTGTPLSWKFRYWLKVA